jgi:hypothetical protein
VDVVARNRLKLRVTFFLTWKDRTELYVNLKTLYFDRIVCLRNFYYSRQLVIMSLNNVNWQIVVTEMVFYFVSYGIEFCT